MIIRTLNTFRQGTFGILGIYYYYDWSIYIEMKIADLGSPPLKSALDTFRPYTQRKVGKPQPSISHPSNPNMRQDIR